MADLCWHHGDHVRLDRHLKAKRIDLYGPNETTEKGTNRLNYWWKVKPKARIGDQVRIVIGGSIVAEAVIASVPYPLEPGQGEGIWSSGVRLQDIRRNDSPAGPL
jgi:hypothetical protein